MGKKPIKNSPSRAHGDGRVKPDSNTDHHMTPTSRLTGVSRSDRSNIKVVIQKSHDHWHRIFENKTPFEAVVFLVEQMAPRGYFTLVEFRASYDGVNEEYSCKNPGSAVRSVYVSPTQYEAWNQLFGKKDWIFAIKEVMVNWSPKGYFIYYRLESTHHDRNVIVTSSTDPVE
jgi:hypothetical protein